MPDGNSITVLVFHINYYVEAINGVLAGKPLEAKDAYSFDCPPIASAEDWENLLQKFWGDAEIFLKQLETLPDACLLDTFVEEKYGTYYRNLHGLIVHTHYHMGQIALLKKQARI